MFDIIEPHKFCENDLINELVDIIEKEMKILEKDGIVFSSKSYEIWEHVPKLGKRLEIIYHINDTILFENQPSTINRLLQKINLDKIFNYSEEHNLELTISPTPFLICFFI